jgi:cytochrome P450
LDESPLTNGKGIELSSVLGQLERYKVFTILQMILPKSAFKQVAELDNYVAELSRKRQARGHIKGGSDMFNYLLENKGDDALSQKEYEGNALTLLFAGADTTATVMIFGSYLLCKNPEVAKQVRDEIRSAFRHSSEINATNVNDLKYMITVLSEIMRLYPPGPSGLARHIVNKAGQTVAGHHVPYNVRIPLQREHDNTPTNFHHQTSCAVYQLAANRLDINFARAGDFCPERWLDNPPAEFAHDRRDVYQPFSFGPRNCIGKP